LGSALFHGWGFDKWAVLAECNIMLKELRRLLSKSDAGLHMNEYFELRRKRVSLSFLIIILIAIFALIPITFLVIHNPIAGFGSAFIGILSLVSVVLVLKGRDQLGSAILLSSISLVFIGILIKPACATCRPLQRSRWRRIQP
jgi:hypothetical protein